jgi:hypothetical protein
MILFTDMRSYFQGSDVGIEEYKPEVFHSESFTAVPILLLHALSFQFSDIHLQQ